METRTDAINEALKLIAQASEQLRNESSNEFGFIVELLDRAIDKLANVKT